MYAQGKIARRIKGALWKRRTIFKEIENLYKKEK